MRRARPPQCPLRRLLVATVLICSALTGAAGPAFQPTGEPPPGFEAFFEPQRTLVDVHHAGRFLLSTPATYDLDTLEFENPEAVTAALDDLVDPARVRAALDGSLDTHAEALCGRVEREGCGRIDPEVAGVIFDASTFRATLFLAPDQLRTRGPDIRRFLPPSDAGFSFLQNLSANYSGSTGDGSDAYNATSLTSIAFAETHLLLENSIGSEDDFTLDAATARREFEGRAVQGGLYRSRAQSLGFVREQDLAGLRLESSLDTRADRAFAGGTSIEVFLQSRARVEILRDGRLLDSRAYEPGNRVLDTRDLPEGAYDIEIRIRGAGGRERVEQRFFVKTTRLPPADQPIWVLEAGRVMDRNTDSTLPEDTGDWLARAGTTRRISDGLGVDLGLAAGMGDALGELGLFRVGRLGEFQASTFASAEGNRGLASLGRLRFGSLRLSVDYRQLWSDGEEAGLTEVPFEQAGARLSMPLRGGVLSLSARHDRRGDGASRSAQSVSWDRTFRRGRNGTLRLSLDLGREDDNWIGLVALQYDHRGNRFTSSLEPGVRFDRPAGRDLDLESRTDARLAWERRRDQGDLLRLAVDGTHGGNEDRIGGEGLYEGRAGTLRAELDRNLAGQDRTTWSGSLNTSILGDGRRISVGGRDRARAAALVEIRGDVPGARFEVLVDGFVRGIAPAGSVTPIHLRPWETYQVRLRPVGSAMVAWENREEQITLYPGNVVRLQWDLAEILVLLGRLVDAGGEPFGNARLEGAYGFAMAEESGHFQAEVLRPPEGGPIELEAVRRDGRLCRVRVALEGLEMRQGIARAGTLRCLP
jgi:outer membrane usher protein FimD/PapC